MDHLIRTIFGKLEITTLSTSDYVDWAGEMLVLGEDSRSLRILASLENQAPTYEAEGYFFRSLTELGIERPSREQAILGYAVELARSIIEEQINSELGVRMLYRVCVAAEYPREMIIWYELDDALDSLAYGHYPYTYPSLASENIDSVVKHEAENFIAAICETVCQE